MLARKPKVDITQILALTISCVLIVFNFIRIFKVPMTIDETGYDPKDSCRDIMLITNGSPNTHILHSIIRKFLVEHFSRDIFFYRVDSLVAQIVFLLFSFRISRVLFSNKWWALLSFGILSISAPLIFDFWGLSRGYALALTFMVVSIYYYLCYVGESGFKYLCLSLAGAILAAYTNFGYFNYFLTLCALVVLHSIIFKSEGGKKRIITEVITIVIAAGLLAAIAIVPFKSIYSNGQNVFLGSKGFIEDTVTSLVRDGFFINSGLYGGAINTLVWTVVSIAGMCGIYWAYVYFKGKYYSHIAGKETRWGILLYLLTMITVASMVAQHLFFGINYLTDRTALFFIFFFILQFIYVLYYVRPVIAPLSWGLLTALFVTIAGNFVSHANTTSTYLWWFDRDDMNMLRQVAGEQTNKQGKIRIGLNWMVSQAIHYDVEQYYPGKFETIQVDGQPGSDTTFDYYYITSSDVTDKLRENYEQKASFVGGGFVLFKKK